MLLLVLAASSTATMLTQGVLEQISAKLAGGGPGSITDNANCNNTGNTWTISDQPGGAVLSGSGRADVDRYALDQARAARFEPMEGTPAKSSNPLAAATFGKMIFEWHTVPLLSTNAPPGSPLP